MRTPKQRRRLLWVMPGVALAFLFWVNARGRAEPPVAPAPVPQLQVAPAAAPPPPPTPSGPTHVVVGLYIQNIHEIDIKSNSFTAEFYIWFRWKGDTDPTISYEIANAVNVGELSKIPIYTDAAGNPVPEPQPDGSKLQSFHIYGRFGQPFPLARYPFDSHDIVIAIEDAKHDEGELIHEIDAAGTTMRPDLQIPGWTLGAVKVRATHSSFPTTFGDLRVKTAGELYSRVEFTVHIDRPVLGIISKTVIPLALILLITFGAFFCQPTDIDARLCLTITALISAVALQITAATELPPTGSLLMLDKIYNLSYATILAVTFATIWVNRLAHADEPERAARVDRWGFRIIGIGYFGILAILVLGAR